MSWGTPSPVVFMPAGCATAGELFEEDYYRWSDHPARQQWEVLKDLGEGAFAQVGMVVAAA